jgi:hypothetical protein
MCGSSLGRSLTGSRRSGQCRRKAERTVDDFYKGSLFTKDQAFVLRHGEILARFRICLQALSLSFVRSEAIECHPTPSHVIRAFIGKKIPDEVATASGNDTTPILGVLLELIPLERINVVANGAADLRSPGGGSRGFAIENNQRGAGRHKTSVYGAAADASG